MSLEAQIQAGTKVYQKLQADYAVCVESRQRLDAQKSENESVQKEFALLLPTNQVWKQVGPVLLKQDQSEAKANVSKRLEFIGGEIKRVETQLAELDAKLESKKMELVHLQTQVQQKQQAAAQEGAGAPKAGTGRAIQASGA